MFCKYCGKEIEDGAKYCSGCGSPANGKTDSKNSPDINKPVKKKKRHPILGAIILVFGIFIIIGAFGSSDVPHKVDVPNSPATATTAEPTALPVFTVGDTLEQDGILVTLNDVSENKGSQFMTPTDGNVFVACEFTIENTSDTELSVSSLLSFECYFDDFISNISLGAMTADNSKNQLDGSVAPGKKIKGIVGYEAPADWTEMEIHYKSSIYSSNPFIFNYSK